MTYMTEVGAVHTARDSAWQLVLQCDPAEGFAGGQESVKRITEIAQELGLQPAEVNRVGTAVMEALRKASRWGKRHEESSTVSIQVWISSAGARDRWHSSPNAQTVDEQKRMGWGFFLVQRQEVDLEASTGKSHHLVELYLYQERYRAPRPSPSEILLQSTRDDLSGSGGSPSGAAGMSNEEEKL